MKKSFVLLYMLAIVAVTQAHTFRMTSDGAEVSDISFVDTVYHATFNYKGKELQTGTHTWLVRPDASSEELAGGNVFRTVKDAMLAVDSIHLTVMEELFTEEHPLSIYISPWVYWMDNPDDPAIRRPLKGEGIPYGLKVELGHTRLIGLSDDPTHTILACNRGQTQGAVGNFTMLHITGEDIMLENLTLGNYCNIDLEYAPNPALNRPRRAQAIVQAQLAICQGDRIAARNCHFISRLNTCPLVGARRTFFENCYFECTDDALCGTGVYHQCRFKLFSGKPFYNTQGTGAVFLDCDLHALTRGKQYLVKAGSPVTMIDCRWTCEHPYVVINWTQDPTDDLRSYQYNLTQDGKPLLIDRAKPHLTVDLTGKKALEAFRIKVPKSYFTPRAVGDTIVYNLRNLLGSTDGWNPAAQPAELQEHTGRPVGLSLSHRHHTLETGREPLTLTATALCFGQSPKDAMPAKDIEWIVRGEDPTCIALDEQPDGRLTVTGCNNGEEPVKLQLVALHPSGLEAACVITVRPRQLPPPALLSAPTLTREGDLMQLHYTLDLQGRADHSRITWLRCTGPQGENGIPVATSNTQDPLGTYRLTAADNGYYIRATLAPKTPRSPYGTITMLTTGEPVKVTGERTDSLYTDFTQLPTVRQTVIHPGFWTLDTYKPLDTHEYDWQPDTQRNPWYYGRGIDGAAALSGLMQGTRGARLLYTPVQSHSGDMELTLRVAPCKTAGQGFGSATGQYMDVAIKFDTHTLTGYALRIVRTTKNDRAVDFQLMQYTDGRAVPISEAVSATCYRTTCTIRLAARGNRLTATVTTDAPRPDTPPTTLPHEVHLEAPITPTPFGGVGIQHTGSTGASATLLRDIAIRWW